MLLSWNWSFFCFVFLGFSACQLSACTLKIFPPWTLKKQNHGCRDSTETSRVPPPPPLLLGLRRIINAVLVSTIQLAWVFISSCHILAASIISHCKAIWVLITGRVHRQGDPSTCHMYSAHANAGTAMSLPHRVMRWYSRKDTVVTHLQQRRAQ